MADDEITRRRKAAEAKRKADEKLIKQMRVEQKRRERAAAREKKRKDAAVLKAFRDGQKAEARRKKIADQNRKKK